MNNSAIIFISDIHFCKDPQESLLRENDSNLFYQKWENHIKKVAKNEQINPKYLVICGDLVEAAKKGEYEVILDFLNRFCKAIKIDKKNVLIVPGNHDIDRNRLTTYCDDEKISEAKASELYDIKLGTYKDFYKKFKGKDIDPGKAILDSIYVEEESLTILGVNSLVKESHLRKDHVGYVDIQKLDSEIESFIKSNESVFVVTHHSVADTYERELATVGNSSELKETLGLRGISTFIYGHHHISESKEQHYGDQDDCVRILEIGSLGKVMQVKDGITYNNRFTIGICEEKKLKLIDYNYSGAEWERRDNYKYKHGLDIVPITEDEEPLYEGTLPVVEEGGIENQKLTTLPDDKENEKGDNKELDKEKQETTNLPVINVTLFENSAFLFNHLKIKGNFREGHFHWKDKRKTLGWINVTSFLGNMEILSRIRESIRTMYKKDMKKVKYVVGYGIEGNVIGSSLVDFWLENDIKYYYYPSVHKESEHINFEKSLWIDNGINEVLMIFDMLPSDKYLKEIIDSNSKLSACKKISILALFCNMNLLENETATLEQEIKRYALAEVDVEVCNKNEENCMICKNQLSKIYSL